MISAEEVLARLKQGNRHFVSGQLQDRPILHMDRAGLMAGQSPIAIILGCSDSRVPAEMIFDQGLGDLFVIRVAGNVVASSQIGSVEFAAERYGTPLVVVLGHSDCGAIQATIESYLDPDLKPSNNLMSIVNRVRPSIDILMQTPLKEDIPQVCKHAVRANVIMSVNQLRRGSPILEKLIEQKRLVIVGAEYSLESGEVEFFYSE